jgi:anti-sigma regulatory factor (Ser/Thr protein kinase)
VEEIFVNIAHYAYKPGVGSATIRTEVHEDPLSIELIFIDGGVPYDPLAKEDPDVSLPADQRQIGGLGIFMAKKVMDTMDYRYENGQNVLTMTKKIG